MTIICKMKALMKIHAFQIPISKVVAEIQYVYKNFNVQQFVFCDAFFPFNEQSGFEFCEELEKVYTVMSEVFGKAINNVAEAKITLDEIRKNRQAKVE